MPSTPDHRPSWGRFTALWWRIGWLSWGGPAVHIELMHRELVVRRGWVEEARFWQGLNLAALIPGPEAQQLACYLGWQLHGFKGAVVAGGLFVLPGLLLMLAIGALLGLLAQPPLLAGAVFGLSCAVLPLLIRATVRLGRRALAGAPWRAALALGSFLAIAALQWPYPLVLLLAAGLAALGPVPAAAAQSPAHPAPKSHRCWVMAAGLLWALPLGLLAALDGTRALPPLTYALAQFTSHLALVGFGGAHAVLAYAGSVMSDRGWVSGPAVVEALTLAESTPGPLLLGVVHLGFVAGAGATGPAPSLAAGLLGGLTVAWFLFVPALLWMLAVALLLDGRPLPPGVSAAFTGVTAAVLGAMAAFALWFAVQLLVGRAEGGGFALRPVSLLLVLATGLALARNWPVLRLLPAAALIGAALGYAGLTGAG